MAESRTPCLSIPLHLDQPFILSSAASLGDKPGGVLGETLLSCIDAVMVPASSTQAVNSELYCGWSKVRGCRQKLHQPPKPATPHVIRHLVTNDCR